MFARYKKIWTRQQKFFPLGYENYEGPENKKIFFLGFWACVVFFLCVCQSFLPGLSRLCASCILSKDEVSKENNGIDIEITVLNNQLEVIQLCC